MDADTAASAGSRATRRPLDILLVEDNPADVVFVRQGLARSAFETRLSVARDGEEALALLREPGRLAGGRPPDLVLLDLNMPGMNGHEVLAEMKASLVLRSIPVIVLTSSVADDDVARAYDHHVNAYVRKPVDFDDLVRILGAIGAFWSTVAVLPPGPVGPPS